jgi:peptidoglycan hydrolase CwlO-like protein
MNRKRTILLAIVLLLTVGLVLKSSATEKVVRMSTKTLESPDFGAKIEIANAYTSYKMLEPNPADAHTFTVYTTTEIDERLQDLSKAGSNDKAKIATLEKDIKSLSDANDALTKRLNELEAKLNARDQSK